MTKRGMKNIKKHDVMVPRPSKDGEKSLSKNDEYGDSRGNAIERRKICEIEYLNKEKNKTSLEGEVAEESLNR